MNYHHCQGYPCSIRTAGATARRLSFWSPPPFEVDEYDTFKVEVMPEENYKHYKTFDHIMSYQWQEEILGLL